MPELEGLYEARTGAASARACGCAKAPSEATCKPFWKLEREQRSFEACMRIAEAIGTINSSKKAFAILSQAMGAEDQEVFGAMYLDTHLQLRGLAETGRGEMDATMAPVKPTLRLAVLEGAQAVLIWHVHPTMLTTPSDADREVTAAFDRACRELDLLLLDHVIIGGRQRYYSFLDAGELA